MAGDFKIEIKIMEGDIYHITNRGIEKRKIFNDTGDRLRFICDLYKFNNKESSLRIETKDCFVGLPDQDRLVEIFKWSLMPNHYHLLVQEKVDKGAINFAKKLGNGYTKYFNIKNERSGYLFQNSAKIIRVEEDKHFWHLPFYIETNPIKLIESEWKEKGIKDVKKVIKYLESYRWSSYIDYTGGSNFPQIINKELFYKVFDTNQKAHAKDFLEWLQSLVRQPGRLT